MRKSIAMLVGSLAGLLLVTWNLASSERALIVPLNATPGVTATIGLGIEDRLGLMTNRRSGGTTTYSDGNYQIQVTETATSTRTVIRLVIQQSSGYPFRLNDFSITARVPRASIDGIWYPGAEPSSTNVMVTDADHFFSDIADANYGIPYVGAVSAGSGNVLALGLGRQDLNVSIEGQAGAGSSYEFRLKAMTPRTATRFDESFYISTDVSMGWPEIATDYADWVDALTNYEPFPVSPRAFEPLYDAWYWSGDRVDERLYLETARMASELGIGLYLADSGWDTDQGEYEKWLDGKTGDYTPPHEKFTDLPGTFSEIRSHGNLAIDLWLQPFAVGRKSFRYAPTKDIHIHVPTRRYPAMGWSGLAYEPFALPVGNNLETVNLCPRMAATQKYLRDLFTEMATMYKPEGYWIDFIDGLATYCVAPHAHDYSLFGDGFRRSLETIKSTILLNDPDAVVHFRARYANLNTKSFANIWQTGDSPGDYDQMRLSSLRLRPFSKGVVFAADQMYWPEGTPETEVSRFIMTSVMTGVPAFGPTLVHSPPETLAILKAWLDFYRRYREDLVSGRFSTFGLLTVPNHKIESEERSFVYVRNLGFAEVQAQARTIFLMNATDTDRFIGRVRPPQGGNVYSVRILNRFLVAERTPLRARLDFRGVLNLNIAIPQGGIAILTPAD